MKYHILPVDDHEPHKESIECKCNPSIENYPEGQIIVHNSFDGRELFEYCESHKN